MYIHSYPSIYNLGHAALVDLFNGPVTIEEKVDGSQFSFGLDLEGNLHARSKGKELSLHDPEKMFGNAVAVVKALHADRLLTPGFVYRGEYLNSQHHNSLTYDRIPVNHIIIFDINDGLEGYLPPERRMMEAVLMGLEVVPVLYQGMVHDREMFERLLDTTSILGGQKIEGVVIKPANYDVFGRDKKVVMGKYVSDKFREIQKHEWKAANPGSADIVESVISALKTESRWHKAVQHLREDGKITDEPKDIQYLLPEIQADVLKECEELIKEKLWSWAWPKVKRGVIRGAPEWYKEQLLKKQFGEVQDEATTV